MPICAEVVVLSPFTKYYKKIQMSSDLAALLCQVHQISKTEREKGSYFEQLVRDFLGLDPRYAPQFISVQSYGDWADEQGAENILKMANI